MCRSVRCSEQGEKKQTKKTDPVPAHKAWRYARGLAAIIAFPKNKRGKMTVEDTVTKSSSGQIGEPALSHKRPPLLRRRPLCCPCDQVPIIGEATQWRGQEGFEMPVRSRSSVSLLHASCDACKQRGSTHIHGGGRGGDSLPCHI